MFPSKSIISHYLIVLAAAAASSITAEVPQENSHNMKIVNPVRALLRNNGLLNDPTAKAAPGFFADPIFGLLANPKANSVASDGDGPCLQQNMADAAFSVAKTAEEKGFVIMYRALERNTGKIGLKSDVCTKTPKNPELKGIQQHQDPVSNGAADHNKQVELAVAQGLLNLGLDPTLALQTATFPPGDPNGPIAGKSCDGQDCIFTQNLLRPVATVEEIKALKKGGGRGGAARVGGAKNVSPANFSTSSSASLSLSKLQDEINKLLEEINQLKSSFNGRRRSRK